VTEITTLYCKIAILVNIGEITVEIYTQFVGIAGLET
jgi:hypothetical protein